MPEARIDSKTGEVIIEVAPQRDEKIRDSLVKRLDLLTDLRDKEDVLRLQFQDRRDEVLTPELRAKLAAIDRAEEEALEALQEQIKGVEAEVREHGLLVGETVKGQGYQAVWVKPRVSWDTRALEGYAYAHPEIKEFKKVGRASISIRKVKR